MTRCKQKKTSTSRIAAMAFLLRGLIPGLSGMLGGVTRGIGSAVGGIGSAVGGAAKSVGGIFSNLFGALGGIGHSAASAVSGVASGVSRTFNFMTSPIFLMGGLAIGGVVLYTVLRR